MSRDSSVLVLGGGLSGCLVAAGLADRGLHVTIIEQREHLMAAASRWNDGKIHLGYTFTGTPSMATAALMQDGVAAFLDGLEGTLGSTIPESWMGNGVVYLVDRASMVDVDTLWERAKLVERLHAARAARDAGMRRYLEQQPRLERLPVGQAEELTGQHGIVGAWRTPERHIATRRVADALTAAVSARDVDVVQGQVVGVDQTEHGWRVALNKDIALQAPVVINCLWESRAAIDREVQIVTVPTSIRYKRALFGSGVAALGRITASTRILGPYGDVVTYGNGDAYLSWYPAGLVARSDDGLPPPVAPARVQDQSLATLAGLGLPASLLEEPGAEWRLQGGYVVAWGYGDIDRLESPLHQRYHPGVAEIGDGFISVDTGKYTLGPLLASRAVEVAERAWHGRPRSATSRAAAQRAAARGV